MSIFLNASPEMIVLLKQQPHCRSGERRGAKNGGT
jgi:hypothetical protein